MKKVEEKNKRKNIEEVKATTPKKAKQPAGKEAKLLVGLTIRDISNRKRIEKK